MRTAQSPSACGLCGINEREHFTRYATTDEQGNPLPGHYYTAPTQEQIAARIRARRAERDAEPDQT
ncbi:hypothetical protein ACQP25_44675 (plasmid) [Microtetraspora malaysiensis]|uniref:hypothetical protein n=1 Tax=Microtetraspora malaysiensis TaxID=161358 RepID=UPI003D925259